MNLIVDLQTPPVCGVGDDAVGDVTPAGIVQSVRLHQQCVLEMTVQ